MTLHPAMFPRKQALLWPKGSPFSCFGRSVLPLLFAPVLLNALHVGIGEDGVPVASTSKRQQTKAGFSSPFLAPTPQASCPSQCTPCWNRGEWGKTVNVLLFVCLSKMIFSPDPQGVCQVDVSSVLHSDVLLHQEMSLMKQTLGGHSFCKQS